MKGKAFRAFGAVKVSTIAIINPQSLGIEPGVEPVDRLAETPTHDGLINFGDFSIPGANLRSLIDEVELVGTKVAGLYTIRSAHSPKDRRMEVRFVKSDPRAGSYTDKKLSKERFAEVLKQIGDIEKLQVKLVTMLIGSRPDEICAHILLGRERTLASGERRYVTKIPSLKLYHKDGIVYASSY